MKPKRRLNLLGLLPLMLATACTQTPAPINQPPKISKVSGSLIAGLGIPVAREARLDLRHDVTVQDPEGGDTQAKIQKTLDGQHLATWKQDGDWLIVSPQPNQEGLLKLECVGVDAQGAVSSPTHLSYIVDTLAPRLGTPTYTAKDGWVVVTIPVTEAFLNLNMDGPWRLVSGPNGTHQLYGHFEPGKVHPSVTVSDLARHAVTIELDPHATGLRP